MAILWVNAVDTKPTEGTTDLVEKSDRIRKTAMNRERADAWDPSDHVGEMLVILALTSGVF